MGYICSINWNLYENNIFGELTITIFIELESIITYKSYGVKFYIMENCNLEIYIYKQRRLRLYILKIKECILYYI